MERKKPQQQIMQQKLRYARVDFGKGNNARNKEKAVLKDEKK
jgi:hypothetical protein